MALTEQQVAFCRCYVANPNATKAAIQAGYSPKTARQSACRLRRRAEIQAEIARMTAGVHRAVALQIEARATGGDQRGQPPLNGGHSPPEEPPPPCEADAVLARAWTVERLMRNVRIAMAEEKTTVTKLVKVLDGKPDEFVAVQVEVFERDAAAANTGLALLLRELDRIEAKQGTKPVSDDPNAAIPHRAQFEAAISRMAAILRERDAEAERCENRAKGSGHARADRSKGVG